MDQPPNEEAGILKKDNIQNYEESQKKRKRRSKHEAEGRNFRCEICDKSYLSQPALNNHKNSKHNLSGTQTDKKARGRPRKYAPVDTKTDNEILRFNTFFNKSSRQPQGESYNISDLVKLVFDDIFVKYSDKCFNQLMHYTDHPILLNLFNEVNLVEKNKLDKNCDEIFYEYLVAHKNLTNKNYFILMLKFVLLFRECMNISRKNLADKEQESTGSSYFKKEFSANFNADSVPDLCNEFVTEFLEGNNYFGIQSEEDRSEIIELIQHFCMWLFLNGYTQSRLSRIS